MSRTYPHPIIVRLRAAREERGLSQKEAADRIGVSENTLWRWENALSRPPLSDVDALADILDLTLALAPKGDPTP
ncbi:helix-turn-helix domain-containing protein [Nocardiopsis synnemataformans]|uniref:helix-turn-helix domain-containing protein n=1 Tax=Nocardiopsis synnemataformans TaxID=61305 RepID=UPI003EB955B6